MKFARGRRERKFLVSTYGNINITECIQARIPEHAIKLFKEKYPDIDYKKDVKYFQVMKGVKL